MDMRRLDRFVRSRASTAWLMMVAFLNSFFLPFPAEILLVPLCIARPRKSWWYALIATISSVAGGLTGYAIGALAYDALGLPIVNYYGNPAEFQSLLDQFSGSATEWILLATISPLPYKLVTITSGVAGLNLSTFVVASLIGRVIGYFSIGFICWYFGDRARNVLATLSGKNIGFLILLGVGGLLLLR